MQNQFNVIFKEHNLGAADEAFIKDPLIDLHHLIHAISPAELCDALNACSESHHSVHQLSGINAIKSEFDFGTLFISAEKVWTEESACEVLLFSIRLKGIAFNDVSKINSINIKYPTIQLINENNDLLCRMFQTLRGGRTVENLLWSVIKFVHDSERLHKDLTIFS